LVRWPPAPPSAERSSSRSRIPASFTRRSIRAQTRGRSMASIPSPEIFSASWRIPRQPNG
jgi:hypothetical protein